MHATRNASSKSKRLVCTLVAIITLIAVTSCALPSIGTSGDDSLQQTSIALSVQSTSIAVLDATLRAVATNTPAPTKAAVQQVDVQATVNAQLTSIASQATAQAPTAAPATSPAVESASPTPQSSAQDVIALEKWDPTNTRLASDCNTDDDLPCWMGQGYEINLESSESTLIDSNWERPFLIFNHNYSFEVDAYIFINSGGSWDVLRSFPKGEGRWVEVALDLSKFKGKEIYLRFHISGPTIKPGGVWWKPDKPADTSRWNISNPRIIPNYTD